MCRADMRPSSPQTDDTMTVVEASRRMSDSGTLDLWRRDRLVLDGFDPGTGSSPTTPSRASGSARSSVLGHPAPPRDPPGNHDYAERSRSETADKQQNRLTLPADRGTLAESNRSKFRPLRGGRISPQPTAGINAGQWASTQVASCLLVHKQDAPGES
jgi:hypothetical protein